MKIVRQAEGTGLCVACCLAMLVDQSLNYVLARVHMRVDRKCPRPYVPTREAVRFLFEHGYWLGGPVTWGTPHSVQDCLIDDPAAKGVQADGLQLSGFHHAMVSVWSETVSGLMHQVVWDNDRRMILDPHHEEPQKISRYVLIDWANVIPLSEV